MQVSHSRISTFLQCPYKYDLIYNKKLETIFNCDPQNPLIIGHALHTGIEKDVEAAIKEYYSAYPVIDDLHVNEAIKLRHLIPRVKALVPDGEDEVKIEDEDYKGFIDRLVHVQDEWYDIYDYKYSNNVDHYLESEQLHLYKYYFEKMNPGKKIRNLYFAFVPKTMIRQKKTEELAAFRKRIISELSGKEIQIKKVDYDPNKVISFLTNTKHCIESAAYEKNVSRLCDWCEFKAYCESNGKIDYDIVKK